MAAFTDSTGREWRLDITLGTVLRVRELAGVDLLTIGETDADGSPRFLKLLTDLETIGRVCWAICAPVALQDGLTVDAWLDRLDGQAAAAAARAMQGALVLFFHRAGHAALARAIETAAAVVRRMWANVAAVDAAAAQLLDATPPPG